MRNSRKARPAAALGAALVLAATLLAPSSRADIGDRKTFVFGVDRVLGFVSSKHTADPEGPAGESSVSRRNLSLFSQQAAVGPYSNPRFSLDYFVTRGLSLGGSIGYWSQNGEIETPAGTGEFEQHLFTIAPRVGYAIMFGDVVGIWPRGGLTYFTGEMSVPVPGPYGAVEVSGLGLNLEAPFVFQAMNHFAILAGPGLDVSLLGGYEAANVDYDLSILDIGLHVGFVGYL